jgi:hypothetical protein
VVYVAGIPVYRYVRGDKLAEKLFVVQALEAGFAKPSELIPVVDLSASTVFRIRAQFEESGAPGLVLRKRGPKGAQLGKRREAIIRRWHDQGRSAREMARRLKRSHNTVRAALKRMGLPTNRRPEPEQQELLPQTDADTDAAGEAGGPEDADTAGPTTDPAPAAELEAKHLVTDAVAKSGADADTAAEPAAEFPFAADADVAAEFATGEESPATIEDAAGQLEEKSKSETGAAVEPAADTPQAPDVGPEEAPLVTKVVSPTLPVESTLDTDPMNREIDRMLAAQGDLNDAAPLFAPGEGLPRAGVLLAVPLIVASGLFEAARKTYGHIGPAFYGLRTTLLTLVLLALWRIKHPENVKEYSPPELGRVLGLDRAPEVKTIRRKLGRLVECGQSEQLLQELVERRVESRSEALGFLYVDGHVRVYSGKADLPKTHIARMRISLPATQDVWVNDADGCPLFFVTQSAHPQLVSALPPILAEVRELVGAERRVTVVFDRGGWSPKLFRKMELAGFDVLTYRKGKSEQLPDDEFVEHEVPGTDGKRTWELHDTSVPLLGGKWKMRQVTRRKGDHHTKIMTTRKDLSAVEVAVRMFDRWRQENFFKYMREQFALDALVEYGVESDDPDRLVPNPARKELDRKVREARDRVAQLEAAYGAAAIDNPESQRPTMRGFKIAHGTEIGVPLREARAELEQLLKQRSRVPTRVPVGEVKDEVVRLPRLKKRLTDGLKMLAYQVETDLVRAVAPSYARSVDEGRRLISTALQSAADIEVVDGELRVTLAPQSSPHRSRAIAELCSLLDDTETCFPGTALRMRFAIRGVGTLT